MFPLTFFRSLFYKKRKQRNSPIQKRISSWKPSSPTNEELETKISLATDRRTKYLQEHKEKNAVHNKTVSQVCNTQKRNKENEAEALENKIFEKLTTASEKKDKLNQEVQKKLSKVNSKKMQQGYEAMKQKEVTSQKLAVKVDTKIIQAQNNKQKLIDEKTSRLSEITNKKLSKGVEALRKQEESSRTLETAIDTKLASASNRKDELTSKLVTDIANTHLDKTKRKEDIYKKQLESAKQLDLEIKTKLSDANERKEKHISVSVNEISSKTKKKIQKGESALKKFELATKKLDAAIRAKMWSVTDRKKKLKLTQVQTIAKTSKKKIKKVEKAKKKAKANAGKLDKKIEKKLTAANTRKERLTADQVQHHVELSAKKSRKIVKKMIEQDEAIRELEQDIQARYMSAIKRKEKLDMEAIESISKSNRDKQTKTDDMKRQSELSSRRLEKVIDKRMSSASARKEKYIADSATKSTQKSSKGSSLSSLDGFALSPTREEIESKLNDAAARRESFLMIRSEQAVFHSNRKMNNKVESTGSTPEANFVACSPRIISFSSKKNDIFQSYDGDEENIQKKEEEKCDYSISCSIM